MKIPANAKIVDDNLMARIWYIPGVGMRAMGKRVPASHPLTYEERRFYVQHNGGSATTCKYLMQTRSISLAEAWKLFKQARGYECIHAQRRKLNNIAKYHGRVI